MKIARIVLTATMLLSLKSTLFCSEKATLTRTKSHDGTRDGLFGSGLDTLAKLGNPYGSQVYALGSDEKAPERWALVGKTIKTLELAQKFNTAVTEKGWDLPEDAIKPSLDLINAENERLQVIIDAENLKVKTEKQAKFKELQAINMTSIALLQ